MILLSVTAVLTAWSGFQAAKWGGAMAIAFSQAAAGRIEASRLEGVANRKQTIQVALFSQWVQADAYGEAVGRRVPVDAVPPAAEGGLRCLAGDHTRAPTPRRR